MNKNLDIVIAAVIGVFLGIFIYIIFVIIMEYNREFRTNEAKLNTLLQQYNKLHNYITALENRTLDLEDRVQQSQIQSVKPFAENENTTKQRVTPFTSYRFKKSVDL